MECSICSAEFDVENEGGVVGDLGILPVAFCPTCYSGVVDMVSQPVEGRVEMELDDIKSGLARDMYKSVDLFMKEVYEE